MPLYWKVNPSKSHRDGGSSRVANALVEPGGPKSPLTKLRAFTERKTREIVWSKIERFWRKYV